MNEKESGRISIMYLFLVGENKNFGMVCSRKEHIIFFSFFKGVALQSGKHGSRNQKTWVLVLFLHLTSSVIFGGSLTLPGCKFAM